jgi:hypothetical protein
MKYSEIPRDLSSDSIAAYRLAQVVIKFFMDNDVLILTIFVFQLGIPWSRQMEEKLEWGSR